MHTNKVTFKYNISRGLPLAGIAFGARGNDHSECHVLLLVGTVQPLIEVDDNLTRKKIKMFSIIKTYPSMSAQEVLTVTVTVTCHVRVPGMRLQAPELIHVPSTQAAVGDPA